MARPNKTRTTTTRTTTTRSATSRRGAAADVEVDDEEETGLGLVDGLVITTTFFLLLGLGTVDYFMGSRYGDGFLF